jgi:phenylacetate-CoA ligase
MRIKGWLGRADQTTKVKGMFVHPGQVAAIVKRHAGIIRARLVVDNPEGVDRMTLHVESATADASMQAAVVETIRDVTKLRGEVAMVAAGTLPNDGKVIEDAKKYD